jgi:hypothetical protein
LHTQRIWVPAQNFRKRITFSRQQLHLLQSVAHQPLAVAATGNLPSLSPGDPPSLAFGLLATLLIPINALGEDANTTCNYVSIKNVDK